MGAAKALMSLRICADSSEPLLLNNAINSNISRAYFYEEIIHNNYSETGPRLLFSIKV